MLFAAATVALGLGLALANYRIVAYRYDWPMGYWHKHTPAAPVVLGMFCFIIGLLYAASRGLDGEGLAIIAAGLLLAVVWIAGLRAFSQVSLLLAPVALLVLIVGWTLARAPV